MALIDVIIPAYNYGTFLKESIHSVLAQTFQDFNVFVIDDGSTDNTKEVVSQYQSIHPNIHYSFQENRGLPVARNVGLKLSTAPFIAFLDADDLWMPEKLEETLKTFRIQPQLGVVYTLVEVIDSSGNLIPNVRPWHPVRGEIFRELLFRNQIVGSSSSVLLRRGCIEKVGGFDESLPSCEDWDLWLRISRFFAFDYVARPLVKIRIHERNMHKNTERMVKGKLALMDKVFRESSHTLSPLKPSAFANIYLTVSHHYMDIGLPGKALRFIFKALVTKPLYTLCHPSLRELLSLFWGNVLLSLKRRLKSFAKAIFPWGTR